MSDVGQGSESGAPSAPMTSTEVAELLCGADTAWTTAQGVTRSWRRQDLVSRAFHRRLEEYLENSQPGSVVRLTAARTASDGSDEPDGEVFQTELAVAADRPLRRRRAELLLGRGPEARADLVVIDGDTFWARTGSELLTNGGNPNSRHGGANIVDELLCPSYVPAAFTLTVDGRTNAAGRDCIEVTACPRTDLTEDERWDLPEGWFDMISGGDDFRLAVDVNTGVILRASKFVDGQLAEVNEWRELKLDPPLSPSLFAPLV